MKFFINLDICLLKTAHHLPRFQSCYRNLGRRRDSAGALNRSSIIKAYIDLKSNKLLLWKGLLVHLYLMYETGPIRCALIYEKLLDISGEFKHRTAVCY